jgi:hypothetical protein
MANQEGFMNIDTPEGMDQAVAWQQSWIGTIKEGGVWMVPRSGLIIHVHHQDKVAVFHAIDGRRAEPDIARVFEAMGWRVLTAEQYSAEKARNN